MEEIATSETGADPNLTASGSEAEADDGGLDTTPAEDQVVQTGEPTEGSDPAVQRKIKDLEAGYTKKYQALADERKQLETRARELTEREAALQYQQSSTLTQQQPPVDPFEDADWEVGLTASGEPISQVMYQQWAQFAQALATGLAPYLQDVVALKQHFAGQQRQAQLASLKEEYGDFDDAELIAVAEQNPTVPLDFVAAKVLQSKSRQQAVETALRNRETKIGATQPGSSSAKTTPEVDTSGWGVREFFEHAKRTGQKL